MGLFGKRKNKSVGNGMSILRYPYDIWSAMGGNIASWEEINLPYDALEWIRLAMDPGDGFPKLKNLKKLSFGAASPGFMELLRKKEEEAGRRLKMDEHIQLMKSISTEERMQQMHETGLDRCYSLYFIFVTAVFNKSLQKRDYSLRLSAEDRDTIQKYLSDKTGYDVFVLRDMMDAQVAYDNESFLYRLAITYFEDGEEGRYIALSEHKSDSDDLMDYFIPVFIKGSLPDAEINIESLRNDPEMMKRIFSENIRLEEFEEKENAFTKIFQKYISEATGEKSTINICGKLIPVRELTDAHNAFCDIADDT